MKLISPKEFFGFDAGEDKQLARWDKIVEYFYLLETQSDCIRVINMGDTTEGNPFLQLIITSKDNLDNIEEIKKNNKLVSDPRGLSDEEMEHLARNGKAVCVQSMSIHSHETGGTQMSIKLAYELLTKNDENTKRILDNVVFVMVPCFNPDGEIKVTDFYYSSLGTNYEGTEAIPFIYHKYAGHDNNEDAIAANLVETQYMNKIMYSEWFPHAYQDFHHMYNYDARIFLGFCKDPVEPTASPILLRELLMYGSYMAWYLEKNDCYGAVTGDLYTDNLKITMHQHNAKAHNIISFLTEAATIRLASPVYQTSDNITGEPGSAASKNMPSMQMPHPWDGGRWGLPEVVEYMYNAAYGLLDIMAKNRMEVLSCMMKKALERTKAGENDDVKAYIIPAKQYDKSAFHRIVNMLITQAVDVYVVKKPFVCDGIYCDTGTVIVPTAQPYYSFVKNTLGSGENITTAPEDIVFNGAESTNNIAFGMGVKVLEVSEMPGGDMEIVHDFEYEEKQVKPAKGYIINGSNNNSYGIVNRLISLNILVYRVENSSHDFYTEVNIEIINKLLKEFPTEICEVDEQPTLIGEITQLKAAYYKRYWHGDTSCAWAMYLFDKFGFECDGITFNDILDGKLEQYDVFFIPDMTYLGLQHGCQIPYEKMDDAMWDINPTPYIFYLRGEPTERIQSFVKNGGRLVSFGEGFDYTKEALNIPIKNVLSEDETASKDKKYLNCNVDTNHPLCYGMPQMSNIVHFSGPIMRVMDTNNTCRFEAPIRYSKTQTDADKTRNFVDRAAIITVKIGKGVAVLYATQPHLRAQTDATFKLLFNVLYKYK